MKIEFYRRTDGRWAWRLLADNGQPIATDGGQGYENLDDALHGANLATAYGDRDEIAFFVVIDEPEAAES
jgi:uncharacterized protein YegP (UPF0339 family)